MYPMRRSSTPEPSWRSTSRAYVGIAALILAGSALLSCGETTSRIDGTMYVPAGLRGSAQWGEVWLVRHYDRLRRDLAEHERLLVLSLLGKDAGFMRSEVDNILRIGELRAQAQALQNGEIPVRTVWPSTPTVTPLTIIDSLFASVTIRTRPASASEQAGLDRRLRAVQDSAIVVRGRMQRSVSELMRQRADQKSLLLEDADAKAEQHRISSSLVRMDGQYAIENVPESEFGLYGRYVLMRWYVLSPVIVSAGGVQRNIPRLPGLITESKAITSLDAQVNRIERMER